MSSKSSLTSFECLIDCSANINASSDEANALSAISLITSASDSCLLTTNIHKLVTNYLTELSAVFKVFLVISEHNFTAGIKPKIFHCLLNITGKQYNNNCNNNNLAYKRQRRSDGGFLASCSVLFIRLLLCSVN